ncbi:unnamed protein product [Trichobilharzia szidati]|nr:unnamed protein product [Trichobilharzia szidati]
MPTLEELNASLVTPTHQVILLNSNNPQNVCMNGQDKSHSIRNTMNSRLQSFQSFTNNIHSRRKSSGSRPSSSVYRSKILKRCGRQLKRLMGRRITMVPTIIENDNHTIDCDSPATNSYETPASLTNTSECCLHQCEKKCISVEMLKDVQNQQNKLFQEVNQLKQKFSDIQNVLVSLQNILVNRITLQNLHPSSSSASSSSCSSTSSHLINLSYNSNNNNNNNGSGIDTIPIMNTKQSSIDCGTVSPLNNAQDTTVAINTTTTTNNNDNDGQMISNPCVKSDNLVYLTSSSSQCLPPLTPALLPKATITTTTGIYSPLTVNTSSFMPLKILTNCSTYENTFIPSSNMLSSSPPSSILSVVHSTIPSHIPLSLMTKLPSDHTSNGIVNLQITPNSINPVNQSIHNLPLNEQTGLLSSSTSSQSSSFPTTQTSQTTPYPPILILNPLQSNYCPQIALTAATTATTTTTPTPTLSNPTSIQTFLPITTTTTTTTSNSSSSSSTTASSTISFSNRTILPKLEDSNSHRVTSYPNSVVPNGTDENIDPLDSPDESIDDSSQRQIKIKNPIEPLNTFEIASTVRDLLLKHNISQRQFSKHVLKLSQGTMSELLSKPRPWHRLTARGRDSFRRLQAWISDPNNISNFKTYQRKRTTTVTTHPEGETSNLVEQPLPPPVLHSDPVEQTSMCQWDLTSMKLPSLSSSVHSNNNNSNLESQNIAAANQSHRTESTYDYLENQRSDYLPLPRLQPSSSKETNVTSRQPAKSSELSSSDENVLSKEEQETERRINQILLAAKVAMDYEKQIKSAAAGGACTIADELVVKATSEAFNTAIKHLPAISDCHHSGICNPMVSTASNGDPQTTDSGSVINPLMSTVTSSCCCSSSSASSSSNLSTYSNSFSKLTAYTEPNSTLFSCSNNLFTGNVITTTCLPTVYSLQSVETKSNQLPSSQTATTTTPTTTIIPSVYSNNIVCPTNLSVPVISTGITVADLLKLFTAQITNNSIINPDNSVIKLASGVNQQNFSHLTETQSSTENMNDLNRMENNGNILFNNNHNSSSILLLPNYSSSMEDNPIRLNLNDPSYCNPIYTVANELSTASTVISMNHHQPHHPPQPPPPAPPIIPPLGISPASMSTFPQISSSSTSSPMSFQQTLMLLASAATATGVHLQSSDILSKLDPVNENHFNYSNNTIYHETEDNLSDSISNTNNNNNSNNNNNCSLSSSLSSSSHRVSTLPPLKQEDIDKYCELSTEEITQRTRSLLMQYSISQKLFGAHVLAAVSSQSSTMTTTTATATTTTAAVIPTMPKLSPNAPILSIFESTTAGGSISSSTYVRSNSSLSPEPLLDQERYTFPLDYINGTYHNVNMLSNQSELEVNTNIHAQQQQQQSTDQTTELYDDTQYYPNGQSLNCAIFEPITSPSGSPTPNSIQNDHFNENDNMLMTTIINNDNSNNNNNSNSSNNYCGNNNSYQRPSSKEVMELATSIQDMDTTAMCSKIKELLQRHSIPQRLFGDVVLGMCQASVSDILSKTRPWSQLSNKARIPYVRLHLWLQEPDHLEILKSAQANIKSFTRPNSNNSRLNQVYSMNLSSESLSNTNNNNHELNLPTSDSCNGQFASITDDTDNMVVLGVNSENDIKPQQYQQMSCPSMTLMTTTETSATLTTSATSSTTRKRTPSSSSSLSFSNQENNNNKSSKLLKIDSLSSSQMTISSPNKNNNNKTKQTTNSSSNSSTQAPIDDLNEDERQSLFDIAKAATAVMLLASSNSSPYRQNRTRQAKMPISPIRKNNNNNNNNSNINVKSRVTSSNSKLHRSITPSQKKALISACKSHENLSSDTMKSLAQDLCLPYKTVFNWIQEYRDNCLQTPPPSQIDSDINHESDDNENYSSNEITNHKSSTNSSFYHQGQPNETIVQSLTSSTSTPTSIALSESSCSQRQIQHNRRKPINPTRLACAIVVNSPNKSLHDNHPHPHHHHHSCLSNSNDHENSIVPVT